MDTTTKAEDSKSSDDGQLAQLNEYEDDIPTKASQSGTHRCGSGEDDESDSDTSSSDSSVDYDAWRQQLSVVGAGVKGIIFNPADYDSPNFMIIDDDEEFDGVKNVDTDEHTCARPKTSSSTNEDVFVECVASHPSEDSDSGSFVSTLVDALDKEPTNDTLDDSDADTVVTAVEDLDNTPTKESSEDINVNWSQTWDCSMNNFIPDFKSKVVRINGPFYQKLEGKCFHEMHNVLCACEEQKKVSLCRLCHAPFCSNPCFKKALKLQEGDTQGTAAEEPELLPKEEHVSTQNGTGKNAGETLQNDFRGPAGKFKGKIGHMQDKPEKLVNVGDSRKPQILPWRERGNDSIMEKSHHQRDRPYQQHINQLSQSSQRFGSPIFSPLNANRMGSIPPTIPMVPDFRCFEERNNNPTGGIPAKSRELVGPAYGILRSNLNPMSYQSSNTMGMESMNTTENARKYIDGSSITCPPTKILRNPGAKVGDHVPPSVGIPSIYMQGPPGQALSWKNKLNPTSRSRYAQVSPRERQFQTPPCPSASVSDPGKNPLDLFLRNLDIPFGVLIPAKFIRGESFDDFSVVPLPHLEMFQSLSQSLQTCVKTEKGGFEYGSWCMVKYRIGSSEDSPEEWYRARITKNLNSQMKLFLVDLGVETVMKISDIYELPPEHFNLGLLAIRVRCMNVKVKEDPDVIDQFNTLVRASVVKIRITHKDKTAMLRFGCVLKVQHINKWFDAGALLKKIQIGEQTTIEEIQSEEQQGLITPCRRNVLPDELLPTPPSGIIIGAPVKITEVVSSNEFYVISPMSDQARAAIEKALHDPRFESQMKKLKALKHLSSPLYLWIGPQNERARVKIVELTEKSFPYGVGVVVQKVDTGEVMTVPLGALRQLPGDFHKPSWCAYKCSLPIKPATKVRNKSMTLFDKATQVLQGMKVEGTTCYLKLFTVEPPSTHIVEISLQPTSLGCSSNFIQNGWAELSHDIDLNLTKQ